ncbi:MAG: DUF2750 domain-containing protein [Bacteroidia bacterium]
MLIVILSSFGLIMERQESTEQREKILLATSFDRYLFFLESFIKKKHCYSILDNEGDFFLTQVDGNAGMFSLWPDEGFIDSFLNNSEWREECEKVKIPLQYCLEQFIPYAIDNGYIFNVFSVKDSAGFVVSAEEFLRDLDMKAL